MSTFVHKHSSDNVQSVECHVLAFGYYVRMECDVRMECYVRMECDMRMECDVWMK